MRGKKYDKSFTRTIPLYGGKLVISLVGDPTGEIYAHTEYRAEDSFEGYRISLNFEHPKAAIDHGVIAHESQHVVNMLAENRGFEPDFTNDEPTAYLLQWVVNAAYKIIKKEGLYNKIK